MEANQIVELIKNKFPGAVEEVVPSFDKQIGVLVKRESLLTIARFLKEEPSLAFNYLADLSGVDYLGKKEKRFEVVYNLYSLDHKHRIRIKVPLYEDETVDSVVSLWKSADWHERETYDLYGIIFNNHPNLTRLMMPEDYDEGHPLRKDFPLTYKYQEPYFTHDRERVLKGLEPVKED